MQCIVEVRNFVLYFTEGYYKFALCIDRHYTMLAYFWPDFLNRVKVYSNECRLWSELHMTNGCTHGVLEAQPQALGISEVTTMAYTSPKVTTRQLSIN